MDCKIKDIKSCKTIEDVLEKSNNMWIGEEEPLVTGSGIDVINHKAIVRSDNRFVLGVVGSNYQPVQNSDGFSFYDILVKQKKASYQSIYTIDGGSRIIIKSKLAAL